MRVRLVLNQKRDVDCVLATVEIEKLIDEKLKENDMDRVNSVRNANFGMGLYIPF